MIAARMLCAPVLRLRIGVVVPAAVLLAAASSADAQSVFTCKDRSGRTISSDRPIAECADRPLRETTPGGILRREIPAPLTAEQQAQKEADERARKLADEQVRERKRRDTALLAAYSSEDQIEQARKRSLVDVEESIRTSKTRLDGLGKEKQSLLAENRQYGAKVPPLAQRRVDDNQAEINDEAAALRMREADVDRINQRYDDELRRYRELTAANRTTSSR